jgi:PAS domain-containing protein
MNGNSLVKNSLVKPSTAAITGAGLLMLAVYASGVALPFLFPPAWSCLGFVAIGIALWLGNEGFEHRIERRIDHPRTLPLTILIIGSAGLVLLIGVVSWSEYLAGKDFGLDRLLFPGSILKTVQHPGRPSPATGFNLALLGLGLLLITSKKPVGIVIREVSAVASFTFSYLTGASYLLSSASVSVSRELIVPITAVLLLAASASLVFSSSEGYLVPLLRNAGPAGVFARWLMPVPLILPLVASLVRMAGGRLGILDARTSGPIISFLDILVAILIVWRSSSQVLEADKLRREAEAKVTKSRDDLDIRVSVRTAELLQANRQLEAEISERKRAEGELQQVNATLSTVIAASPLGICVFNRDRTIRQRNSAAETMLISAEHEFDDLINRAGRGEVLRCT